MQPALAAPTRTEILLVALVKIGETGMERAKEFLDQQAVVTMGWDRELADAAALALQGGECGTAVSRGRDGCLEPHNPRSAG